MSQTHQLKFRELPCEIVEIETLRLTLFIKLDHQISNGWTGLLQRNCSDIVRETRVELRPELQ
jgi:hypothetical protein